MKRNFFSVDQTPIPLSPESIKKIKQLKTYLEFCQMNMEMKNKTFSEIIRLKNNNPFYDEIPQLPRATLSITKLTNYFNKNEEIEMKYKKFANEPATCTIFHKDQIVMKIVGIHIKKEAKLLVDYETMTKKNNQPIESHPLNFTASFSGNQNIKMNEDEKHENKMSLSYLLN